MALLKTRDLVKNFGGIRAVNLLNLTMEEGEIRSLIGPNGAGKTTVFNLISGILQPNSGTIDFQGVYLNKLRPHERCQLGIGRTFQTPHMFSRMNVLENIMLGCHSWTGTEIFENVWRLPKARREEDDIVRTSEEIISFLELSEEKDNIANSLPFGKQKMVAIGRALASKPKLLLLDEPCAGLNESETEWLCEILLKIRKKGINVFLIEHDMGLVMKVSDTIVVVDYGKKIAEGTPAEIVENERVISAYLGSP